MPQPVIRCAVPTLNAAATLDWTLLSLRSARDAHVETIVVDSGSTDRTLEICARWAVAVRYDEPGNMYRAVNVGLADARTPWVTYLNGDDYVYPGAYASLIECAERAGADAASGDFDFIDENGRFLYCLRMADPDDLLALSRMPFQGLPQAGTIISRRLYEFLGGFCTDFRLAGDFDFFARGMRAGAKFVRLDQPVCAFRLHRGQQTVRHAAELRAESLRVGATTGRRDSAAVAAFVRWRMHNIGNYVLRYLRTHRL
ncbi:MAG: glycosyltransferase, partial [Thermoanaerobaculia bacterium]